MSKHKNILAFIGVTFFSLAFLFLYIKFNTTGYLPFSDAAKFADIARNIVNGLGYNGKFSFWSSGIIDLSQRAAFPSPWLPPLMPFSIALAFKLFGISDMAVVGVSSFYFLLLVIFTFLLGKKLFGNLVGVLAAIAVASSIDFLNYATNGATESMFTMEIVASLYFITLRKKWATIIAFIIAILMYFTRPQAFIYIAGLLLYWLLVTFKTKKAIILFSLISIAGLLIDYFVLPRFAGNYFLYSVTGRGIGTATQVAAGGSASDSLRGAVVSISRVGYLDIFKKLFYNFYNFYKLAPQILNPYLLALFVIGIFKWGKDKVENSLKISSIFMVAITLIVAALSIPFFRYVHPVVPLIYIFSIETLVWIFGKMFKKRNFVIVSSFIIISIFIVGQTFGVIFLDSRFERTTHNLGKPPVYVLLSNILKQNTGPKDFVVTNLDTWGSWYGDRRTIWYPVEPKQLVDSLKGKSFVDAIYLTSYLIDDQNYYMGSDWRTIFDNPENPKKWTCDGCLEISKEFKLKSVYTVPPSDDYERQDSKAVLLIKK